ncbi:MAG: agmatinase [Bacillota bacterium]
MNDRFYTTQAFIGARKDSRAKGVLYGLPMDWTTTYRAGARFGPTRIREASWVHEEYSPYLRKELGEVSYCDSGDLQLVAGNIDNSLEIIYSYVKKQLAEQKVLFGIGGEHLVTWPIVKAFYEHYQDLVVVQLDAHADLCSEYEGQALSHATVMYQIANLVGSTNVYQFGLRSFTRAEEKFAANAHINFYPFQLLEPIRQVIKNWGSLPVYLTVDIDVLDPAYAPGTGTPEPGGFKSSELLEVIHLLVKEKINIVGVDLVEVAPNYDLSERTVILAAKILREMLLGFL